MTTTVSISRDNLYAMLSAMSLPDRRWLAKTLTEQIKRDEAKSEGTWVSFLSKPSMREEEYKAKYDKVFASFSKDWGGDADAMSIARALRDENANTRTVETW